MGPGAAGMSTDENEISRAKDESLASDKKNNNPGLTPSTS